MHVSCAFSFESTGKQDEPCRLFLPTTFPAAFCCVTILVMLRASVLRAGQVEAVLPLVNYLGSRNSISLPVLCYSVIAKARQLQGERTCQSRACSLIRDGKHMGSETLLWLFATLILLWDERIGAKFIQGPVLLREQEELDISMLVLNFYQFKTACRKRSPEGVLRDIQR